MVNSGQRDQLDLEIHEVVVGDVRDRSVPAYVPPRCPRILSGPRRTRYARPLEDLNRASFQ